MPVSTFSANRQRHDPYRTFKIQILIDRQPVAGFSKMGALKNSTEALNWRSGGDLAHVSKLPRGTVYEAITLERGLSHDLEFETWANRVNNIEGDAGMSLSSARKDIVINIRNPQGRVAISYLVKRAWVSEYQSLPEHDAGTTDTVGILVIKLEHEGWVRDEAVTEPKGT